MNRSKLACKAMFLAGAIGLSVALLATPRPANALIQTPLPQLLPIPAITPPPTPAPLAPPINPGYAPAPADGLSPILSQSVPLYEMPQPTAPAYPAPQLPGPIDQQKVQAYRNSLVSQQWQLQSQGLSPGGTLSPQILQQLSAPDAQ
jgi:hypothetical protein